ncbi:magnesium transporter MgtE N-terminal domain-containing protein [Aeromicrobium sp. 50.2.37]|uniref:magnesium transporter MgtE N-terminal domain-containing protein n=1 Tax=Aeromicrobium sp. 50.2.37 TaxID=2969305 RepID=UPI00215036E7|nr:CBS domain-containing protein [Aeromicrobium sp. 50.2.37]MCR4513524.1 CBS domain-containing protein [Aeromicrobium sp. 50.2.37]
MSSSPGRIFLSRIVGQEVFDPAGDQVGKLRDVVVAVRSARQRPRVVGLVVEVLGRRRVFLPIGRVTSLDSGQIITTGVLNVRRFEKRSSETLAIHELLDRTVSLPDQRGGTVYDLAMEQDTRRDWFIGTVAVQETGKRFGRRGATHVVDWDEVTGLVGEETAQGATHLLATMDEMRPADLANALLDLPAKRRTEIVGELVDERLADVLEELPDTVQVEILGVLDPERAADVLEEMDPDDAADLLGELPAATSEQLLALMEPEDAEDVRRLLVYEDRTAGGMMTTEPVILPPDATIAEALARVREPEIGPALASMVYVCRPPVETPTGRFLGIVHVQALLREPPSTLVGGLADNDIDWPRPDATLEQVASLLASYDMLALPVVDENNHLIGAVTIDDVLDHLLPEGWRERDPSPRPAEVTSRG